MEIENTAIYPEVQTILSSGPTSTNVTWQALIHYGDDNQTYQPFELLAVAYVRDYVSGFTEVRFVSMMIPLGDYARLIYPNRSTLMIELTQQALLEGTDSVDDNQSPSTEQYTAVLLDKDRSPTIAQGQEVNGQDDLNLSGIIQVDFQIYDKALEQLRVMDGGGGYVGCKLQDAIKTALTKAVQAPKVTATRAFDGVDIIEPDNDDLKGQIVIPHGVRVLDIPEFLQHRYGIYNSGLGAFVQNKNWFIYPLYDTSDFNNRQQTLTLIILPKRKFSSIERTFDVVGSSVTVLVTSETAFKDDSGAHYLNYGSGARFADANTLMENPVTTSNNKTTYKRDDNNSEFLAGTSIGVPNPTTANRRITANPFVVWSNLAASNGGMLRCVWQNSDPSIVTPGMAAKIVYVDGDNVVNIYGVVHRTENVSAKYGGFGNPRYRTETLIDLFVNAQAAPLVA